MNEQAKFNHGITSANIKESDFTWLIKNYSVIKENLVENKIISPTFKVTPEDPNSWCLILYPSNGFRGSYPKYLSISFSHKEENSPDFLPVRVKFSLALINGNGAKTVSMEKTCNFEEAGNFDGFNKWIHEDSLSSGFLRNDELTIFCQYTVFYEPTSTNTISFIRNFNPYKFWDMFEKQWESKQFYDFTLIAPCGKKLRAHKFILASRSPVFSAMFDSEMKETMVDQVEISDISFEGLREMLRFMYAVKIKNIDEVAEDVLKAGEKYQIPEIKDFYEEYFIENLDVSNSLFITNICLRFNMTNLKDHVKDFIRYNGPGIVESPEFEKIDDSDVLKFITRSLIKDYIHL